MNVNMSYCTMVRRFAVAGLLVVVLALPAPAATPFDGGTIAPGSPAVTGAAGKEASSGVAGLLHSVGGWFGKAKKSVGGFVDDLFDKAGDAWGILERVANLPGWIKQGHLSDKEKAEFMTLAKARPDLAWPADRDIGAARNAHRSTTRDELREALTGNYDYIEADLRLEGPGRKFLHIGGERRPVVAHDSYQTNGILFEDWVPIVKASGRGIKVDFKDNGALDGVIAILKKNEIPDYRLNMNIGVGNPPVASPGAAIESALLQPPNDKRIAQIRAAFPKCIINLSPGKPMDGKRYTERQIAQLARYAKEAGQPVMFPMRSDYVTPELVAQLKPYGKVAVWNDPSVDSPKDIAAATARFRAMGVDGTIDLRQK